MGEPTAQSGLVVVVPEAESAVGRHRQSLDVNARLGVPAHVTVLFPFVPPRQIDAAVLARLERLFARTSPFDYRFARTAWFDDDVLWLAPDDPSFFRHLTETVYESFPDHPPFEGLFDDVVPHLTVGHGVDVSVLRAAENAVARQLPVTGRATEVTLLTQGVGGGIWTTRATFTLGRPVS
jgi:hypothetical protein